MFSRRIFVIAFALFTVTLNTACPRDLANDAIEKDKLTKEYNEKVDIVNSLETDLSLNNSIYIRTGMISKTSTDEKWPKLSPSERLSIRNKLNTLASALGRMIELFDHKNLKDETKALSKLQLLEHQKNVREYTESLDAFEKK